MNKFYLVSEYHWEDCGDYWYCPGDSPCYPRKLFRTREEAMKYAALKTRESCSYMDYLGAHTEGSVEYLEVDLKEAHKLAYLTASNAPTFEEWEAHNYPLPTETYKSAALLDLLQECFQSTFYSIDTLEVE